MRIASHREAVLRLRVDDEGGLLIDAAATPVLSVKDWDGVALAGAEVPSAVTRESQGVYRAELPGRTDLEILTANWSFQPSGGSFTRTQANEVLVVSDRIAPLPRFREDPELSAWSAPVMSRLVDTVEDWFRQALGFPVCYEPFERSWIVPSRSAQVVIPGIAYPKTLTSLTVGGDVVDVDGLEITGNSFRRSSGSNQSFITGVPYSGLQWSGGWAVARGTHGMRPDWQGIVPEDLKRAAVILARYCSRQATNYPERASQVAEENTLIYFSTPTVGKPTGLPEVDGVVTRYALNSAI